MADPAQPDTETALVSPTLSLTDPARIAELEALIANAAELEANRHGTLTRKAYESDFTHFVEWCEFVGLTPLPAEPETIYLYLSALTEDDNAADWAVPTLERRLSAIKWVHETSGHESPVGHTRVKELMAGIRRTHGRRPDKADALSTEQISQIIDGLDLDTMRGLRDRAIILFGFAGAFRRSELVSLTREQLVRSTEGYLVQLMRTKDDQEGQGRDTGIPAIPDSALCPVAGIDAWLTAAEITEGPVFRRVRRWDKVGTQALSPQSFSLLLKQACVKVGIPPDRISGHSVRAGHLTEAARNGAPDRALMYQAGHKSMETTHGYIRPGTVFRTNSANYLGLDNFANTEDNSEATADESPV